MTTTLSLASMIAAAVLLVGAICLSRWAWKTFNITILAWMVAAHVVGMILSAIALGPQFKMDSHQSQTAITALEKQSGLSPPDLLVSITNASHLFPLLVTLCFVLLTFGELAHVGPRLNTAYQPSWAGIMAFRFRAFFGVMAVILVTYRPA